MALSVMPRNRRRGRQLIQIIFESSLEDCRNSYDTVNYSTRGFIVTVSIEALSTSVVVRRAGIGSAPFGWEIHRSDLEGLVHVSLARFGSMDAAYAAGTAQLPEFTPKRSAPPGAHLRAVSTDWSV